jgi:hypothetical protein
LLVTAVVLSDLLRGLEAERLGFHLYLTPEHLIGAVRTEASTEKLLCNPR